ncbi:hypothetical protein V8F20_011234 [Naviculisporaceae sp. PSN 640]
MDQGWPASFRKRGRDDDPTEGASAGTMGFTEHRSKRLQALPLRSSPSKRIEAPMFPLAATRDFSLPDPPRVMTPGPSPLAETESFEEWADEPELIAASADMEMMDIEPSDQTRLEPGPSQPDADTNGPNISGRMPTPIQCSFAQQVRGSTWTNDTPVLPSTPQKAHSSVMGYESVPRSLDGPAATAQVMADWNHVQNRRLPSPISESGGEDSPNIILDSSPFQQASGGHLSQVTHDHPMLSTLPRGWGSSSSSTIVDSSPNRDSSPAQENMEWSPRGENGSSPLPFGRKGHTRSKHTVNSWTALQPGMKRSFSIGYRADCEKCRMKVPGHFNHIILS